MYKKNEVNNLLTDGYISIKKEISLPSGEYLLPVLTKSLNVVFFYLNENKDLKNGWYYNYNEFNDNTKKIINSYL